MRLISKKVVRKTSQSGEVDVVPSQSGEVDVARQAKTFYGNYIVTTS